MGTIFLHFPFRHFWVMKLIILCAITKEQFAKLSHISQHVWCLPAVHAQAQPFRTVHTNVQRTRVQSTSDQAPSRNGSPRDSFIVKIVKTNASSSDSSAVETENLITLRFMSHVWDLQEPIIGLQLPIWRTGGSIFNTMRRGIYFYLHYNQPSSVCFMNFI